MPTKGIYKDYQPENKPNHENSDKAYWFVFNSDKLLIKTQNNLPHNHLPFLKDLKELNLTPIRKIYLGILKDSPCYVAEVKESLAPQGMSFGELKSLYSVLDEDIYLLAGKAIQILNWDKNHQFCGQCGTSTETMDHEMAKICPECGFFSYPRLSPAVITAIVKDDKLLMAKHTYGLTDRYGLVAGFVEAGETLEEAVQREITEEVGLQVKNIKYYGSQSWPYPNSLMIGFTAEYESGQIHVDGKEIADAKWFKSSEIDKRPSKISISGELIDWFIDNY